MLVWGVSLMQLWSFLLFTLWSFNWYLMREKVIHNIYLIDWWLILSPLKPVTAIILQWPKNPPETTLSVQFSWSSASLATVVLLCAVYMCFANGSYSLQLTPPATWHHHSQECGWVYRRHRWSRRPSPAPLERLRCLGGHFASFLISVLKSSSTQLLESRWCGVKKENGISDQEHAWGPGDVSWGRPVSYISPSTHCQ